MGVRVPPPALNINYIMPQVIKENIDALNATIKVTIDRSSYSGRLESELKKYQQKAQIKGFRKGKAPMGYLKKAFGQSILAEIVNEMLQEELNRFLSEEKDANYLGQPLPSENQQPVSFDPDAAGDFEFLFDIGQLPPFEVKGLDESTVVERYTEGISEEDLEKDFLDMRQRMAKTEEIEDGAPQEGDLVSLHVEELEDGQHKEGGIHQHFSIRLSEEISPDFVAEIAQKKIGEAFALNPFAIRKEADDDFVRQEYLGLDPDADREVGNQFEARIESIRRSTLPAVDQSFFDSYFGEGKVSSETEAKEMLREELVQFFDGRAKVFLHRSLREKLLDLNREQLELPEPFLKRWLISSYEEIAPEKIDEMFGELADNLRWSFIRNKIIAANELEVTIEEVRAEFGARIQGMFGGQFHPSMIEGFIDRMMDKQEEVEKVANDIMDRKVLDVAASKIKTDDKPISLTELLEKK
jgi:trigger factor